MNEIVWIVVVFILIMALAWIVSILNFVWEFFGRSFAGVFGIGMDR